jgi:hypothetical protein
MQNLLDAVLYQNGDVLRAVQLERDVTGKTTRNLCVGAVSR